LLDLTLTHSAAHRRYSVTLHSALRILWVGSGHPSVGLPFGCPDAPDAFRSLLSRIAAQGPFLGPLRTMDEWRAARRSLRVRHLLPDGRFDAEAVVSPPAPQSLTLEDPSHRVLATLNR